MADSVTSSPITQHEDLDPARVRVINEPAGMMLDWLRDVIYRYFLVLRAVNPGLAPPVRALLLLCPSLLNTDPTLPCALPVVPPAARVSHARGRGHG